MGQRTRPAIRPAVRAVLVAVVACATVAIASAGTAHAAGAAATPGAQTATVHAVAASAQARTNGYWTKARMESATPVAEDGVAESSAPAAPSSGTAASGTATIPNPVHFDGVPTVGALFFTTGTQSHFCTASVVDSLRGDIILTAAHCVYGTSYATDIAYVPEWHDGSSPYGMWTVTSITVAQGWISAQDPDLDFAFLTVAPPAGHRVPIQRVTGGLRLGVNAGFNHKIYVIGYNNTDSEPIGCSTASTEFSPTQMRFYCNDYWDGTSGGPWILGLNRVTGSGTVFGDIGGYEQGGDYPYLSYSPYYSWPILQLFVQAQFAS